MKVIFNIFIVIAIISLAAYGKGSSDCSACYYSHIAVDNLKVVKMQNTKIWEDIPTYEGVYQISCLGDIKSLKGKKERILKPGLSSNGYLTVMLYNGIGQSFTIHTLMAITFMNHTPDKFNIVVDHKDFNKLNNRLTNLRLVTNRENSNKDHIKNTSKYTGVCQASNSNRWRADITLDGKSKYLGTYGNELEAVRAYQLALKTA